MAETRILCGNEAVAQGAYEAGIRLATSYPGTPASEIMGYLLPLGGDDFYPEWTSNEKVALEMCFGASTLNLRSLCSMKANGFNLCVDSLMSLTKKGLTGGLVLAVVDDPDVRYSDVLQDTTKFMNAIGFPVLEPKTVEECRSMAGEAFEISEKKGVPVFIRITNKLGHLYSPVEIGKRRAPGKADFDKTPFKFNPYSKEKEAVIPYFCKGCPHESFYGNLAVPEGYIVNGDIGCYEMAGFGNNEENQERHREVIDTLFVMGSGINVAQGHLICGQKSIALCGDSTFWHCGINGLINAVDKGHNVILFIMDNSCVAMTGQQDVPGLSIEGVCESMGCRVQVINPYDKGAATGALNSALEKPDSVNVIISRAPCMLKKQRDLRGKK